MHLPLELAELSVAAFFGSRTKERSEFLYFVHARSMHANHRDRKSGVHANLAKSLASPTCLTCSRTLGRCAIEHRATLERCKRVILGARIIIESQERERRRQTRYKAPEGFCVAWQGGGKRDVSRAETLSMGGVFLRLAKPLPPGTNLELIFDVSSGEVRARAIVRHAKAGQGMGVKFMHMQADDRARLNRFVQHLEAQKRKSAAAALRSWFTRDRQPLDAGEIESHHALFALLHGIYSARLTGKLQLVLGQLERQFFFDGGQLVFATSSDPQDSLGHMMLRERALKQSEFEEATALMETGQRFGSALAEMGLYSVEEVTAWVQRQLIQITATVLDYPACRYYFFNALEKNVVPEIAIPVPLGKLLLEAVRRAQDLPLKPLAEDGELWVEVSPDPILRFQAAELDEPERQLLSEVSGTVCAKEFLAQSGLGKDKAAHALYALLVLGIVVCVSPGAATVQQPAVPSATTAPLPEPAASRSEETENQKQFEEEIRKLLELTEKATYYEMLGVTGTSAPAEVKQSFHRLARKFHPDRHMGQSEWIGLLQELMSRLTAAYKTLVDEKKRACYDKQLVSRGAFTLGQDKTESQETVDVCLARAKERLRAHNFAGSILWLRKCVEIAPHVATYNAMLARSLAAVPQYRQEAIRRFEKAIELDAWNTSVYFQFAELFEVMRLPWRAVPLYRKILEIDPAHSKASARLRELDPKREEREEKSFQFVSRLFQRKI
jgi:curved DNA-binding protein CbpA